MSDKQNEKSKALSAFLKNYPLGHKDWHIPIFKSVDAFLKRKLRQQQKYDVVYPGCHRHITPSLVFPSVTYIDIDPKVESVFADETVKSWLVANNFRDEVLQGKEELKINFKLCDFSEFQKTKDHPWKESYHLMISACAGVVSAPCRSLLKPGGYLLVSDAHYDARAAYVQRDYFSLIGYFEENGSGELVTDSEKLDGHFMAVVKKKQNRKRKSKADDDEEGKEHSLRSHPITQEQVDECLTKPKKAWSFELEKSAMFYLFHKKGTSREEPNNAVSSSLSPAKENQRRKRGRE